MDRVVVPHRRRLRRPRRPDGNRRRVRDDAAARAGAGVQPTVAIGTDLASGAVTKTLGAWRHVRRGTVDARLSGRMVLGPLPGVVAGSAAVGVLHPPYGESFDGTALRVLGDVLVLGAVLVVVAVVLVARHLIAPEAARRERRAVRRGRVVARAGDRPRGT